MAPYGLPAKLGLSTVAEANGLDVTQVDNGNWRQLWTVQVRQIDVDHFLVFRSLVTDICDLLLDVNVWGVFPAQFYHW